MSEVESKTQNLQQEVSQAEDGKKKKRGRHRDVTRDRVRCRLHRSNDELSFATAGLLAGSTSFCLYQ